MSTRQTNAEPQKPANSTELSLGAAPHDLKTSAYARFLHPAVFLSGLFVFALAIRCAYNFYIPHVNNFASCDAYEYIENGRSLLELGAQPFSFWHKSFACLFGYGQPSDWVLVKTTLAPLKDFYISGPVFPAFLAGIAVFAHASNVHFLWPQFLFGNSVASALTCVFISLIAERCFGRKTGYLAGVLASIYPGFIVNSGRLYSETFAAFLLSAISYLAIRGFAADAKSADSAKSNGNNFWLVFASGFMAAALQLTRSVMVVLTLALLPLTAIQQRGWRRVSFLLPFVLGFAVIALPWLGFQKLAFGGGGLVVDRVGHYNFFIGNNVDTQGWLSYPYPDGRNVEDRAFPELMRSAVKKSPSRWVRLMLDKPLRLFKFPWNDFRTPIGFIDFKWQVLIHELIVLFACLGLGLNLFVTRLRAATKPEFYGRLYLAGLLAFHCIYYLFITVPRYNLCAMPEMLIFAAASLTLLAQTLIDKASRTKALLLCGSILMLVLAARINMLPYLVAMGNDAQNSWLIEAFVRGAALIACTLSVVAVCQNLEGQRKLAKLTSAFLAICMLPLFVVPLRANGRTYEWTHSITFSSKPVKQELRIPVATLRGSKNGLYLLIDTLGVRENSEGFSVSVNGESLKSPILPSMSFAENFDRFIDLAPGNVQREGERMWDSLCNSADCSNINLRQWSMILLPPSILQKAIDRADAEGYQRAKLAISISNHSPKPLELFGAYETGKERILPSVDTYSWEKVFYGVENSEGLTDTRYDIKLPTTTLQSSAADLSDAPGLQNGSYNLALLSAPAASINFEPRLIATAQIGSARVRDADQKYLPLNIEALPRSSEAIWIMEIKGRARVLSGDSCPAANLRVSYEGKDKTAFIYNSAWSPRTLADSREWKDFEFAVPIKPLVERGDAREAMLSIKLATKESPYLNLQKFCKGEAEFADLTVNVYAIPSNPIGLGHQVH